MPSLENYGSASASRTQAEVDRAGAEKNSGPEEYVKQLVEHYLDHDAWFRQQVKKGLEQHDRCSF